MSEPRYSQARDAIASKVQNPSAFTDAVNFFEYWCSDGGIRSSDSGNDKIIDYAHLIGSTRSAMHFALYIEPTLPADEDLNGDDGGRTPDFDGRYPDDINLKESLTAYKDRLLAAIAQERGEKCVQTWVDYPCIMEPGGYSPSIININDLLVHLRGCHNAIGLGDDSRKIPFFNDKNAESFSLKIVPKGKNTIMYGLRPDDRYTIHGSFFDHRTRNLAIEIYAQTQLGIRIFVPEEDFRSTESPEPGVHLKHATAIIEAIEELLLFRETDIRYGVTWDQYHDRKKIPGEKALSSQLTDASTLIFPSLS